MNENKSLLAISTLEAICRDVTAPAAARAQAARTLLELAGLLKHARPEVSTVNPAEMTVAQLDERLEELRRDRRKS